MTTNRFAEHHALSLERQDRTFSVNRIAAVIALGSASLLAACGGGGSGPAPVTPSTPLVVSTSAASPGPSGTPSTAPAPTNTPTASPAPTATPVPTASLTGSAKDRVSGAPLVGFTVTVGSVPDRTSCNTTQSCATPVAPLYTAVTAADGSFTVSGIKPGAVMVVVAKDNTYAALHQVGTLAAGSNPALAVSLTALDSIRQSWLVDYNNQRATVSFPVSFANQVVDEYAQEQADQWAADVASGKTAYGDAGYGPYQAAYGASAGSMYGAAGVLTLSLAPSASRVAANDNVWMGEKANCPNGNWMTCTYTGNTGHYMNISNTNDAFIGLGYSNTQFTYNGNPSYGYDVMIVQNVAGPSPLSKMRRL